MKDVDSDRFRSPLVGRSYVCRFEINSIVQSKIWRETAAGILLQVNISTITYNWFKYRQEMQKKMQSNQSVVTEPMKSYKFVLACTHIMISYIIHHVHDRYVNVMQTQVITGVSFLRKSKLNSWNYYTILKTLHFDYILLR